MMVPMTFAALALAAVLLFGAAGTAVASETGPAAEVEAASQKLHAAFASKDRHTITAMMTPDHQAAAPWFGKPVNVAQELDALDRLDFTIDVDGDVQTDVLSPDVVLLTYTQTFDGSVDGRAMSVRVFTSEVWVKGGSGWQQRLYQATPVD